MKKTKLKPCPFCGSNKVRPRTEYVPSVKCPDCFAIISFTDMPPFVKDADGVVTRYNRRSDDGK